MASLNARNVARDVIKATQNKERIVLGKIVEKRGYGKSTIAYPKRVTNTKSYQEETKPFLTRLLALRDKIINEMSSRNLSKERFNTLSDALAKNVHDSELLSGNATESQSINIEISEVIANKNKS